MSDPFVGEVHPFAFGFAPKGWALCNGQSLPINQNQALFSLLGITYGGNGTTTFNLPDLRGRTPIGMGSSGGQNYPIGQNAGAESVTLATTQLASHAHAMNAVAGTVGNQSNASGALPAKVGAGAPGVTINIYAAANTGSTVTLASDSVASSGSGQGGGQSHENRQPTLAINFCIALQGYFPTRS